MGPCGYIVSRPPGTRVAVAVVPCAPRGPLTCAAQHGTARHETHGTKWVRLHGVARWCGWGVLDPPDTPTSPGTRVAVAVVPRPPTPQARGGIQRTSNVTLVRCVSRHPQGRAGGQTGCGSGLGLHQSAREDHLPIFRAAKAIFRSKIASSRGISDARVVLAPMRTCRMISVCGRPFGSVSTPIYAPSCINERNASTSAASPPCTAPVRQKDDWRFYFVHDLRHPHAQPDSPDELRAPGSSVATTAGRRRRGVATWGGSPRVSKRDTVLRASRALSMRLGLHAGHVGAASHTPTRNAKPYRMSDGSRPPAALGAPHSDERSDQLGNARLLRGPGRIEVPVAGSQADQTNRLPRGC